MNKKILLLTAATCVSAWASSNSPVETTEPESPRLATRSTLQQPLQADGALSGASFNPEEALKGVMTRRDLMKKHLDDNEEVFKLAMHAVAAAQYQVKITELALLDARGELAITTKEHDIAIKRKKENTVTLDTKLKAEEQKVAELNRNLQEANKELAERVQECLDLRQQLESAQEQIAKAPSEK